jgi:hypothetical protein
MVEEEEAVGDGEVVGVLVEVGEVVEDEVLIAVVDED